MVSEEIDLVTEPRLENGLNSQIVFQEESLQFNCVGPQESERRDSDSGRKTREVSAFVGEKLFSIEGERYFTNHSSEFRRNLFDNSEARQGRRENPDWNHDGSTDSSDDDVDDDDDDDEEDDEVEERDGDEVHGLISLNGGSKNDNSSGSVHSCPDKLQSENHRNLQKQHSLLGSSRGVLGKDVNGVHSANNVRGSASDQHHQQGRGNRYENAVTVAEPDLYYSHFLQGPEGSNIGQKEIGGENGCGFSGGKEASMSVESGESLRAILSDPITGTLMDDAMILPCGHSFGSGGLQHVIRMKACYTCSQSVTEDSVAPNLSLRYAIQAFRREEELHSCRASKRRRERFEQDKSSCGDLSMYISRGKGVQFPFAVTDRVVIKGNKRTPLRFVGREAVVTTQCLNGWYVVKTLDNAESVKLQYRSLAKVSDSPSSNMMLSKTTAPNWL